MTGSGDCLDPDELDALATGRADAVARARGDTHVDRCSECRRLLVELARIYGTDLGKSGHPGDTRDRSLAEAPTLPAQAVSDAPPAQGSGSPMLGRYRLGERLGAGGMGVVFAAHDPELDRRVAIKLLHPDPAGTTEQQRLRLLREAQAMARLSHPNVVAIYDVGRVGEQVFVAVELVEGTTLTRWLQEKPRTQAEILRMFVESGRGLAAAHAVGLVHRDFKPDNVLIGRDGRARVTDFGLARPVTRGQAPADEGEHGAIPPSARGLGTAAGTIVGTPAYMPREQLRGELADARSDQFAYCVSLYEALFGARPFAGRTLVELVASVEMGRMTPPPPAAPRWLRQLLVRGLSTRPEDRFADMPTLLAELERDRGRLRRMALTAGGMTIGAAALVGLFAALSAGSRAAPSSSPTNTPSPTGSELASKDAKNGGKTPENLSCGGGSILDHYGADDRATLLDAVANNAGTAIGDGRNLSKRLGGVLDAYVSGWKKAKVKACQTKGGPDPLVVACLDDRRRAFESLTRTALHASFNPSARLLVAAEKLPSPARCLDVEHVGAIADVVPQGSAAVVELARQDVADLRTLAELHAMRDAEKLDAHVLADADKTGYAPLVAEAQLAHAIYLARSHHATDEEGAERALETAVGSAKLAHRDDLVHEAAIELVGLVGITELRIKDSDRWVRLAESTLPKDDSTLERRLLRALAGLELAQGENSHARERLQKVLDGGAVFDTETWALFSRIELAREEGTLAVEHAQKALDAAERGAKYRDDPRIIAALLAVGDAQAMLGHGAAAYESDHRAERIALGTVDMNVEPMGQIYEAVGRDRLEAGDLAEAEKSFSLAISHRRGISDHMPEESISLRFIAKLRLAQGKPAEAVKLLRDGLVAIEDLVGKDDARLVAHLRALAQAERAAADGKSAAATLARALTLAEKAFGPLSAASGPLLVDLADLERSLGDKKAALDHYDTAILVLWHVYGLEHRRIEENLIARAELSLELRGKDEARRLYQAALDDLEKRLGKSSPEAAALRKKLDAI